LIDTEDHGTVLAMFVAEVHRHIHIYCKFAYITHLCG